jgi:hypothetical protein
MENRANIGLIGLAVMGENLVEKILDTAGQKGSLLIYYRHNATISEHIHMKELINQEVNFSIPTGPTEEEIRHHQHMRFNLFSSFSKIQLFLTNSNFKLSKHL